MCTWIGTYSIPRNFILALYTGIPDLTQENKKNKILNFGYSGETQKSLDTERKKASESYPLIEFCMVSFNCDFLLHPRNFTLSLRTITLQIKDSNIFYHLDWSTVLPVNSLLVCIHRCLRFNWGRAQSSCICF